MTITVKPLNRTVGAEIGGVDISKPFDDATYKEIRKAWLDYGVIVFRGQTLDDDQQLAFALRFGELQKVRTRPGSSEHPAIMYIGNAEKKGVLATGDMQFHSDQCYYEHPACGSMLYALQIPSVGGNTLFADCRAAFDDLPAAIKKKAEGLKALNIYDYDANATEKAKESAADAPQFVHPVIRTHPETGRKSIYVNRLMTDHILDMAPDEGKKLLQTLYEKIEERQYVYEHVWQLGDLLMWDNRRVAHARSDFNPDEKRWMRRITVVGDRPY
jgi:taurine dioxygenase